MNDQDPELRRRALHSFVLTAMEAQGPDRFDRAVGILGGINYEIITAALSAGTTLRTVDVDLGGEPGLRIDIRADGRWQGMGTLPARLVGGAERPADLPERAKPEPEPDAPGYGLYL